MQALSGVEVALHNKLPSDHPSKSQTNSNRLHRTPPPYASGKDHAMVGVGGVEDPLIMA
jgi:hypothetical protein